MGHQTRVELWICTYAKTQSSSLDKGQGWSGLGCLGLQHQRDGLHRESIPGQMKKNRGGKKYIELLSDLFRSQLILGLFNSHILCWFTPETLKYEVYHLHHFKSVLSTLFPLNNSNN